MPKMPETNEVPALPDWVMETRNASEALDQTHRTGHLELKEKTQPFKDKINARFWGYIEAMSPYLPDTILIEDTETTTIQYETLSGPITETQFGLRSYLLPKTCQTYEIDPAHRDDESLNPESKDFIGFENIKGKLWAHLRDNPYKGREIEIIELAEKHLSAESNQDPHVLEAKESFKKALEEEEDETKRIKEEWGQQVKHRLENLMNIIKDHIPERRLPEYIPVDSFLHEGFYFLPKKARIVWAPSQKKLFNHGTKPNFSRARKATPEEWYECGNLAAHSLLKVNAPWSFMPAGWGKAL